MPRRGLKITLQPHAIERWHQYVGKATIQQILFIVRGRLETDLKKGIQIDHTGAAQIEIRRGELWAVAVPEFTGGWTIVTFHKGELMAEKAEAAKEQENI